jgi:hypothetical protein
MPGLPRRRLLRIATALAAAGALPGGALVGLSAAGPARAADGGAADAGARAPALTAMLRHRLLVASLYRLAVSRDYVQDGAAGANRAGYRWIEEQRQGVEWIVRGYATRNPEWLRLGWTQLDWGLARQQGDGGFGSEDPFHSSSFFVEALARACLIDPAGASPARVAGLARAAAWLMSAPVEERGAKSNQPYTHRRYILAAAFGQAAKVTGEKRFGQHAGQWLREGLALQQADGTNPEKGGFDAGYQMVGVLMALRYLPACDEAALRARVRAMVRRAVPPELARQRADGSIDPGGSTRIELEHARSGQLKDVPYGEIMQALVYGAQALPEPAWVEPARRIAQARHWLRA